MYSIRRAQVEDIPYMLGLIRELAHFEHAEDEVTVSLEEFKEYGFGAQPLWYGFVAEKDQVIIGMAICYFRYSTWKGKRLYLEDIVITESYRRKGIGQQLMHACIEFGKEEQCHGMVFQVLDWNQSAIDFYKKWEAKFDEEWLNVSIDF